jgi:hypothetical protein
MAKKQDWNKRMKVKELEKQRKNKNFFVAKQVSVEEIMDESGEVLNDTIIKISFEGLLIHVSIATAIKLNLELSKLLK